MSDDDAARRAAERALDRLDHDHRLRPTTTRARLIIIVLAVLTAVGVLLAVLDPWERLERLRRPPPDRPACAPGQTQGCVGAPQAVIVVPASAPGR